MYLSSYTTKFKKDYKRAIKRGYNMNLFKQVYDILVEYGELPPQYKPHQLTGNWAGYMDAHIKDNWVLIYRIMNNEVIFVRMGTHSDLF